ncbi:uncharacterized protein LOC118181618 [Stegodyphus dumicola]|uniref:uncharacterized protein LOC118181618 n=1 Tax=Stegodyphus dumicola TaxID=202533 RepID=UPI0015B215F1|nr:uncharacterized protein LOC118181618 [Stegodyphus dumicola]
MLRTTGLQWGAPPWVLKRWWYQAITERIVLYGAAIWGNTLNVSMRRLLLSMQRLQLLLICKGYRTTSTTALQVLAGIPPLDLQAERESLIARVLRLDGSKTETGTGSAFCVLKGDTVVYKWKRRLGSRNSVFQAELAALKAAINYVKRNRLTQITIYSDSASSLDAIKGYKSRSQYVQELRKILLSLLPSERPCLTWVPAHVGIKGNEEADTLAKEAAKEVSRTELPDKLPRSHLKKITLKQLIDRWQARWDTADTGRRTYMLFPKTTLELNCNSGSQTQFYTGHCPFLTYLHRISLSDTERCQCGEVRDPDHYVFHCTNTTQYHIRKPSQPYWPQWAANMRTNKAANKKLQAVISHCQTKYSLIRR